MLYDLVLPPSSENQLLFTRQNFKCGAYVTGGFTRKNYINFSTARRQLKSSSYACQNRQKTHYYHLYQITYLNCNEKSGIFKEIIGPYDKYNTFQHKKTALYASKFDL